ncbi:hypothetical protein CPB85DRAFT_213538 [Mucidula mucida]|nr:hypothetical protein CPB85DRAFT_213538 [Mucidula mucida]
MVLDQEGFPCPACGKVIQRKSDLKRHYRTIHRGDKFQACTVTGCRKLFSRADALARHVRGVHKDAHGKGDLEADEVQHTERDVDDDDDDELEVQKSRRKSKRGGKRK